jgi:cardiolipin synthase (CMP-forming)
MNVPNTITLIRILLVPVFAWLWWRGAHAWALAVFVTASVSDVLDGFLARVLNQRTKLGQFLDPAADKLLMLVGFLTAALVGALPVWLVAIALGKDLLQAIGSTIAYLFFRKTLGPERWKPTRLGKYTTFTQVFTIALALLAGAWDRETLRPYVGALAIHAAVLTVIASIQYTSRALFPARLDS